MSSHLDGLSQPIVEQFIDDVNKSQDLYGAMDRWFISIPEISQREDVLSHLVSDLEWQYVTLLLRLVHTYRATGESPRFGTGVDWLE